jgi:hypothetical protein
VTPSARLVPVLLALALGACQSAPKSAVGGGKSAALKTMEQVAVAAHRCWIASGDAAFTSYGFANELNSFSGKPRFLLVPKGDYGGRPLLVVQAQGLGGTVETFGPLMDEPAGTRIAADVRRWAGGSDACNASA